jgi:hypothetical protein
MRVRRLPTLAIAALAAGALLLVAACSEGDEQPTETSVEPAGGAFQDSLALLPAEDVLRGQISFADLDRLREAYPGPRAYGRALQGVWLPDALIGAAGPLWRRSFGLRLGMVDRFVAGGFHPEELLVAVGTFTPDRIEETLKANGWAEVDGLLSRGEDGSVDTETPAGRLALSSLDRVSVTSTQLVAASTTELAQAALAPEATLADDENLPLAAGALGTVTSATLLPPELVRPPAGTAIEIVAASPAVQFGIGVDDQGPESRILKIVLVYEDPDQAVADAGTFRSKIAGLKLSGEGPETLGALAADLSVQVVGDRAVLVTGQLAPSAGPEAWRTLLERGDLAVLVRQE